MLNTQYQENTAKDADTIDLVRLSKVLAVSFARECGFRPLPWMQRGFYRLLDEGFEYHLLLQIIEQTSHAPRPSWAYLDAIVRRCRMHEIFTLVGFTFSMPRHADDWNLKWAEAYKVDADILDEAIKNFEI